jgi:hypothetical protein
MAGSQYAYGQAEAQPVGTPHALLHYVAHDLAGPVRGRNDAPPPCDEDADGIPDYVQRAAQAADEALARYEQFGFRPPRPDGVDVRPDIYIVELESDGGLTVLDESEHPFVLVSSSLVRGSGSCAGVNYTPLEQAVAHELFHVVQYAYVTYQEDLPLWIAEGSANGLMLYAFPSLDHGWVDDYEVWLKQPWRSLISSPVTVGEQRIYGSGVWWFELMARVLDGQFVVSDFFKRLAAVEQQRGHVDDVATRILSETIADDTAYTSLWDLYTGFSVDLYTENTLLPYPAPGSWCALAGDGDARVRETRPFEVDALATHYVHILLPSGTLWARLAVLATGLGQPRVALVAGGRHGRIVHPLGAGTGTTYFVRPHSEREAAEMTLIVTSSSAEPARYRIRYSLASLAGRAVHDLRGERACPPGA